MIKGRLRKFGKVPDTFKEDALAEPVDKIYRATF